MAKLDRSEHSTEADAYGVGRFGIVTALPEEFAAMCMMLDDAREKAIPGDPNDYRLGGIPASDGSGVHIVVITLLKKAGNNSAAAAASHLLRSFPTVEDVLMVGIAGGCPCPNDVGKHVRLGDCVVSNEYGVVQYDHVKLSAGKVDLRDTSSPPSAALTGKTRILEADRLSGKRPWEENILRASNLQGSRRPPRSSDVVHDSDDITRTLSHPSDPLRNPKQPKVHYGKIGAANILLKDPKLRDALRDDLNVRAIEMEGSGIADGAWIAGKNYMLIRGVCDYCDSYKSDLWHMHAAIVAAAYARALIAAFPAPLSATKIEADNHDRQKPNVQFNGSVQGVQIGNNNTLMIHSNPVNRSE